MYITNIYMIYKIPDNWDSHPPPQKKKKERRKKNNNICTERRMLQGRLCWVFWVEGAQPKHTTGHPVARMAQAARELVPRQAQHHHVVHLAERRLLRTRNPRSKGRATVDGRNPAPGWGTIVCWCLQGNRIIPVVQDYLVFGWCEMDLVHPQQTCFDQ